MGRRAFCERMLCLEERGVVVGRCRFDSGVEGGGGGGGWEEFAVS